MNPSVTIFIPTLNAGPNFTEVLDAVLTQDYEGDFEIAVVDSSSDDGLTHEALASRHVPFEVIPRSAFNHGQTRNHAAQGSQADIIVFLSQDAQPSNDQWLAELVAPMKNSPHTVCFSAQEPKVGCHPYQRLNIEKHMHASMTCLIRPNLSLTEFSSLDPLKRVESIRFDNVSSAINRQVLLARPFETTMFAEDLEWARRHILTGGAIAFCSGSVVLHSHDVTWNEFYSRVYAVHETLRRLCDFVPVASRPLQLRRIMGTCLRFWKSCLAAEESPWTVRLWGVVTAPFWAFLQMEAMYRGGRNASYLNPEDV